VTDWLSLTCPVCQWLASGSCGRQTAGHLACCIQGLVEDCCVGPDKMGVGRGSSSNYRLHLPLSTETFVKTHKSPPWLPVPLRTSSNWHYINLPSTFSLIHLITTNYTRGKHTETHIYTAEQSHLDFSALLLSLSSMTKTARSFPRLAISLRPTPVTFGNATKRSRLIHRNKDSSTSLASSRADMCTESHKVLCEFASSSQINNRSWPHFYYVTVIPSVLWWCWLGDRNEIWHVETFASKTRALVASLSGRVHTEVSCRCKVLRMLRYGWMETYNQAGNWIMPKIHYTRFPVTSPLSCQLVGSTFVAIEFAKWHDTTDNGLFRVNLLQTSFGLVVFSLWCGLVVDLLRGSRQLVTGKLV